MLNLEKLRRWRRQYEGVRGQLDAVQAQRSTLQAAIRDAMVDIARGQDRDVELERFRAKYNELSARYAKLGEESSGILGMVERGTEYARNEGVLADDDVDLLDGASAAPRVTGVVATL